MKKTKRNIKLFILSLLSILCFIDCSNMLSKRIYYLGDQLNMLNSTIINTYRVNGEEYKEVKHKATPNTTFLIYGKKNKIFFYNENNLNKKRFAFYHDFLIDKFKQKPIYLDSTASSGDFICKEYLWEDSTSNEFAILSSCRNVNDKKKQLGLKWDIEIGNDSIMAIFQNIDK